MPFTIAEPTPWADDPHLPPAPDLYAYYTAHGQTLTWTEHLRTRMPIGDEPHTLSVPAGTPLLIALRVTTNTTEERPPILEETRQRADQIELAYALH